MDAANVLSQVGALSERLGTQGALVWPLFCVSAKVLAQPAALGKLHRTKVTLEGPFLGVKGANMLSQVARVEKFRRT